MFTIACPRCSERRSSKVNRIGRDRLCADCREDLKRKKGPKFPIDPFYIATGFFVFVDLVLLLLTLLWPWFFGWLVFGYGVLLSIPALIMLAIYQRLKWFGLDGGETGLQIIRWPAMIGLAGAACLLTFPPAWNNFHPKQPLATPPPGAQYSQNPGYRPPAVVPEPQPATAAPPGEVPPASDFQDLLGYWSFDEVTPTGQVADLSGRGNHGTTRGAASAPGIKGKALYFNGRNAGFDYGASADFNFAANAPFTFACWVKTQALSGNVVAQRNILDGGAVIALTVEQRMISCTIRQDRDTLPAKVMSKQPVADGAWHHLVVTRKPDGSIELFFDGASQGITNVPSGKGPITTDHRALAVEPTWAKQGHQSYIGIQTYLEATLDEFCIFDRPLTIEEIKNLAGR